ncbi:MAG: sensor histidine kinase [Ferruginibacter sp.]
MAAHRFKILLLCFVVCNLHAFSQLSKIDSLTKIINNNNADDKRIIAYKELANLQLLKNFDDCIATTAKGYALAAKTSDSASLGDFTKLSGQAYYFKGNYDSAAVYFYKALRLLYKDEDALSRAAVLNELGKLYRKTKDLDRALQNYDEAFAIYKSKDAENDMATILNESGVVFEYKEDYTEAAKRYQMSLDIKNKLKDTVGVAYSLNFLGGVSTLQKKFADAEKYLRESLRLRQIIKDTFAIALNYSDMGSMYGEQANYTKAIDHYLLSNQIATQMKYSDLLLYNYKEMAGIEEKNGNTALSLDYLKKHFALKDSVYTSEKMKQIEEMNAKYESEKKEVNLKLQKAEITKKNYLLWGAAASLVFLFIAGFTFYRKRQTQHKLQLQAEVMNQQELATKAIIAAEENERKRIAADLHDGVGQIMSAAKMNLSAFESEIPFKDESQKLSFEKIIDLVDESCKEIRSVSHQMMPNALLKSGLASAIREFIDKLDSRILKVNLHTEGLNERLESNVETVLYRVIQECVNNVIKHSGANILDISLIKDKDGIAATIEDNGKGFNSKEKEKFEGIGLKNILSRIAFLKGTVDFDSSPGNGTLVAIHVPLV